MNTFFDPVNNTAAVEQLNKELGKDGGRTVLISGCIDTQEVHISSAIASGYKYMLIVTSDEAKARKTEIKLYFLKLFSPCFLLSLLLNQHYSLNSLVSFL